MRNKYIVEARYTVSHVYQAKHFRNTTADFGSTDL